MRANLLAGPALVVALGATADASPLAEALERHGEADVAALRDHRDDAAARCTLGAIYSRRNDLPRAALYLTGCEDAALPDDIAGAVQKTLRGVKRRLDASRYAALDILSHPEGLTAEIDALPGESFTTPATVWVAPGAHEVRATLGDRSWSQRVTTEPRKNTVVVIETGLDTRPPPPKTSRIDFVQDDPGGAIGEQVTGPPPDVKHPSLLKDKYRGIPDPAVLDALADPLAGRALSGHQRELWLGVRLGGGMFDDGSASARPGLAVALAARYRVTGTLFAAARADWSRRGGAAMTGTVDVLGASAGVGLTVLGATSPVSPRPGVSLALIGQLRGDLRLAALRDTLPVHRAGASVAAGVELALPATPFTLGLRFEQGVTELVAGARDRALLAEVGIDLR